MSPTDFRVLIFVTSFVGIGLSAWMLFGGWASLGALSVTLLASLMAR